MGIYPTVFQTEIHAIEIAALENIKNNPKGKKINIISDSQAALKAIMFYTIKSGLVWNCLERLKELARGNKLTLMWTPGHEGIEGNEMADTLARKGSEIMLIATFMILQHIWKCNQESG
ncbi:uncharacterized protein [Halyomorpha halys]|uniref:uncharacterized protein n=1 Tax=Halyomorpha halys TaxID=286706 RepID=UPI0034D1E20D